MPLPPGEAVRNPTIVNTEVDYRDEDDIVSAGVGTGNVSLNDHKGQSCLLVSAPKSFVWHAE